MSDRVLGPNDEPQKSGAIVAVNFGDYRRQEVWVRSGANVGNWYCLGNEFGTPPVWDDPVSNYERMMTRERRAPRPVGTVPQHPDWDDVLSRGPVTLVSGGDDQTYRAGWAAGRRDLWQAMEDVASEDPPDPK